MYCLIYLNIAIGFIMQTTFVNVNNGFYHTDIDLATDEILDLKTRMMPKTEGFAQHFCQVLTII